MTFLFSLQNLGKSNLMDAISFVFGERTQSLRVRTVKVSINHPGKFKYPQYLC